jgi:hypothetical protein
MLVFRWAQEYGLPATWFHAAANASWPSTMPEGQAVRAWPTIPLLVELLGKTVKRCSC